MLFVKRPKVKVILDESLYGQSQLKDGIAFPSTLLETENSILLL
jgi:hypothetical protein